MKKEYEVGIAAGLGASAMWMVAFAFGVSSFWTMALATVAAVVTAFLSYRPYEIWAILCREFAKIPSMLSVRSRRVLARVKDVYYVLISASGSDYFSEFKTRSLFWIKKQWKRLQWISAAACVLSALALGHFWFQWVTSAIGVNMRSLDFVAWTLSFYIVASLCFGWLKVMFDILGIELLLPGKSSPKKVSQKTREESSPMKSVVFFTCAAALWPLLAVTAGMIAALYTVLIIFNVVRAGTIAIANAMLACASMERMAAVFGAVVGGGTSIAIFGANEKFSLLACMALGALCGYGILCFRKWRIEHSPNQSPYFAL